jgi:hypothetical protein
MGARFTMDWCGSDGDDGGDSYWGRPSALCTLGDLGEGNTMAVAWNAV